MEAPVQVVVIGSCNIDLISYAPRLPKLGETLHGSRFEKGYGGKGANQCVMAARLGARCAMVAKLGEDDFGHETLDNFRTNCVNVDHVMLTQEASSGVATITVDEKGDNSIVIVSGANMALSSDDVIKAEGLIAMATVVVCQLEITPVTTLTALQLARKHGVTTIFNPAPGIRDLDREFFKFTDILCLNESEAETLLGQPVSDLSAGSKAVKALQLLCSVCIVLTLGEQGLLYSVCEEGAWSVVEHIAANQVEAVDTTGAGDAFVGGLAYYITCGGRLPMREKLRRASVVATNTVLSRGTQASYRVDNLPKELLMS